MKGLVYSRSCGDDLLYSLTREVEAEIRCHEGRCADIVLADYREQLADLNTQQKIRRSYLWLSLYKGATRR